MDYIRRSFVKGLCCLILSLFFFVGPSFAKDVTLQWDPNSEPDLMGYLIYYKDGSGCTVPPTSGDSCFPVESVVYDGTGALEGPSPIAVVVLSGVTELPSGLTKFGISDPPNTPFYEIDNSGPCEFTLHDFPDGSRECFVLRAFDTEGFASNYSNEACVKVSPPKNLKVR